MKNIKKALLIILLLISLSLSITILVWDPQWLSRINGIKQYVWWEGIWHAFCFYPHFIRNIFVETNCISHNSSFMYYVVFGLTLVAGFFLKLLGRLFK